MITEPETLVREGRVFARYLIGREAEPYVIRKYGEAHGVVESLGRGSSFDRALVRAARRGPHWAGWADAYARWFAPRGLLRRKLILLFAILETSAPSCRSIDLVRDAGAVASCFGLLATGLGAKIRLLVGLLLFVPLRLFHRGEGD